MSRLPIVDVIKKALCHRACVPVDAKGYVATPQDNLVPGVRLDQFDSDLQQGGGHELAGKFRALHSSSVLAVNTFAPFKNQPHDLILLGQRGFGPPTFEHQLPTGLKGTPPTLDVFFRCGDEVVAIESKFFEYFSRKNAKFSPSYSKANLPFAEDSWWKVMEDAKKAGRQYLDVAQLVKHYFGLIHLLEHGDPTGWKPEKATLLYLFWEPDNWQEVEICQTHRGEITDFQSGVSQSKIHFRSISYPELWRTWASEPSLETHIRHLRKKYVIHVSLEE